MEGKGKITVVINTYNAERYLGQVLEAVKDFDETLVCDMESTDNTQEIAREAGCRVVVFPKGDHKIAEPARTFAIQSASNEWVLVVDADEIVTPELRRYLYDRIANADCPQGLYIPRQDRFMGKPIHSAPDYQLRFFIRQGTVWPPVVHSFPKVNGEVKKIPLKERNVMFVHLQDETVKERLDKTNMYTDCDIIKKNERRYNAFALVYRPLWTFVKAYFVEQGFKDGVRGLIRCGMTSVYQFVFVAKIIEKNIKNKKP